MPQKLKAHPPVLGTGFYRRWIGTRALCVVAWLIGTAVVLSATPGFFYALGYMGIVGVVGLLAALLVYLIMLVVTLTMAQDSVAARYGFAIPGDMRVANVIIDCVVAAVGVAIVVMLNLHNDSTTPNGIFFATLEPALGCFAGALLASLVSGALLVDMSKHSRQGRNRRE